MKVGKVTLGPPKIDIEAQLLSTLKQIDFNLSVECSPEEMATLLNAKATTLLALQKYE